MGGNGREDFCISWLHLKWHRKRNAVAIIEARAD